MVCDEALVSTLGAELFGSQDVDNTRVSRRDFDHLQEYVCHDSFNIPLGCETMIPSLPNIYFTVML